MQENRTYYMILSIQDATHSMRSMLRHQAHLEQDTALKEQLRQLSDAIAKLEAEHIQTAFEMADDLLVKQTAPKAHLQ